MIVVIADTSGLPAALDSTHPEHDAAQEAIMAAGLIVMSPLLLAELDHVANRELGREAAVSAIDLDLTDVVNVALAADYDTDAILTLDRRDFRAVRPLGHHKAFRVQPDDLPL
ncbi:PIN domain-containing protein [Streptomyces violaceusniger]|uniref:Ribonuclease VapC n=1 Tax=Streptomyces violaceusniger TaxID=68280 RepID=A0A4D4L2A6_STRVO|nr:ribonuclease VapC [Streptomyces violaceusniger]